MGTSLHTILLTPNACGADGISALSRQVVAALPGPLAVVSLHDEPESTLGGVEMFGASGSRARFCAAVARLAPQCSRETVVICCHVHLAPAARLLTYRAGRSVVMLCGIEAWVRLRATERWALAASDLVAISAYTAARFRDANPAFRQAEITVVHPGLPDDPSDCEPAGPAARAALIVGRMANDEAYKGHDLLIDVWPRVLARHPDAKLWVVGDGSDRVRLAEKAARAGLADAIVFKGRVDDRTRDSLYRQCRFFAMPSRDEGFGLVFLEAMRAGKACVGANGAASEIIRNGETGLLVDPADSRDVGEAILRLFDDDSLCEAFGAAGLALFRSRFTDTAFQIRLVRACAMVPAASTHGWTYSG